VARRCAAGMLDVWGTSQNPRGAAGRRSGSVSALSARGLTSCTRAVRPGGNPGSGLRRRSAMWPPRRLPPNGRLPPASAPSAEQARPTYARRSPMNEPPSPDPVTRTSTSGRQRSTGQPQRPACGEPNGCYKAGPPGRGAFMQVLRALARPMLASIFVVRGYDTFRQPERVAPLAEPVVRPLAERMPAVPAKTEQAVRINGAVQMAAGSLLAFPGPRRSRARLEPSPGSSPAESPGSVQVEITRRCHGQ
jgi:hypothetical protein